MAKHDVGVKRRKGTILGIKLSSEPGYDINDVMGGMIFDNYGNRIDDEAKKHYVTEEDLSNMRVKLGGYLK